jgi:hypothetical protein
MTQLEKQLEHIQQRKEQALKDVEEKYDKMAWDVIDHALENNVQMMTKSDLLEKYGDMLSDEEKEIINNL